MPRHAGASHMPPDEVRYIRKVVLGWSIPELADALIDPYTGEPVSLSALNKWSSGANPVPLWVARRLRDLAEKAEIENKRT